MGFSQEWDDTYQKSKHLSIWPWSDLVSYVMRYCRPSDSNFSVLEIGCGAGANIPFFKHLGVRYYSVDASQAIVERLKDHFPEFAESIVVADFTKEIPFETEFDLVVDRASITHNKTEDIERSLEMISQSLKSGGKFIGIDWFSTSHSNYTEGGVPVDNYTKTGFEKGQFTNLGNVHFSDKSHIIKLFQDFEITHMEHKLHKQELPETGHMFASWNFVAVKR